MAPIASRPPTVLPLGEHVSRTLRLAFPVMLARAGMLVMASVDTIMSGRLGGDDLAYYAIALAPFIFFMLIGNGLLMGTVVMVSQADGAGRLPRCGRIWRLAMLVALVAGGLFTVILARGEAILLMLGQSPDIARGGGEVLFMLALGMPPMLLFVATSFFLEGISRPRAGMVVMGLANLVNLGLNWLLMFEPFGLPAMGAAGAALATSITRASMALALITYVLVMPSAGRYGTRAPMRRHWPLALPLMRLGFPMSASYGLETGAFMAMALFAGWLGPLALAAYQVALSVTALVYMLAIGIATATAVRVGNAIGRRDPRGMVTAGWVGTGLAMLLMMGLAPLLLVGRGVVTRIYTTEPQVALLALELLLIVAPILIVDALQGVLLGALRGTGDVLVPTLMFVVSFWMLSVPMGHILAFGAGMGVSGLMWALFAGLLLASILLGWRFVWIGRRAIAGR